MDCHNVTELPPTKIKRQYKCTKCNHATINPREHLKHRIYIHGEKKVKIVECPHCVYACQYRQKLNRHLKLVHHVHQQQQQQHQQQHRQSTSSPSGSNSRADNESLEQKISANFYAITSGINALVSQRIQPSVIADDKPVDLSYPPEYKLLIKYYNNRYF